MKQNTKSKQSRLTTKSYFAMRLRDSGYRVDKLDLQYSPTDKRKWSMILDMSSYEDNDHHSNVFITCYKDGSIIFYDGGQYIPNIRVTTDSIDVVIEYLNSRGIINKHPSYGTAEWVSNYESSKK